MFFGLHLKFLAEQVLKKTTWTHTVVTPSQPAPPISGETPVIQPHGESSSPSRQSRHDGDGDYDSDASFSLTEPQRHQGNSLGSPSSDLESGWSLNASGRNLRPASTEGVSFVRGNSATLSQQRRVWEEGREMGGEGGLLMSSVPAENKHKLSTSSNSTPTSVQTPTDSIVSSRHSVVGDCDEDVISARVKREIVCLESTEPLVKGSQCLVGHLRVCSPSRRKRVFVRYSTDNWHTCADRRASYVSSPAGKSSKFKFELPLSHQSGEVVLAACYKAKGTKNWSRMETVCLSP